MLPPAPLPLVVLKRPLPAPVIMSDPALVPAPPKPCPTHVAPLRPLLTPPLTLAPGPAVLPSMRPPLVTFNVFTFTVMVPASPVLIVLAETRALLVTVIAFALTVMLPPFPRPSVSDRNAV